MSNNQSASPAAGGNRLGVGHTSFTSADLDPILQRALDNIFGATWCAPAPSPVGPEAVTVDKDGTRLTAVTVTYPTEDGTRTWRVEEKNGGSLDDPSFTGVTITCDGEKTVPRHPLTGLAFGDPDRRTFTPAAPDGLDWVAITIEAALADAAENNLTFSGAHDPQFGTASDPEASKALARLERNVVCYDETVIDLTEALGRELALVDRLDEFFSGKPIKAVFGFVHTRAFPDGKWQEYDNTDEPFNIDAENLLPDIGEGLGKEFVADVTDPMDIFGQLHVRATNPDIVKINARPVVDISGLDDGTYVNISRLAAAVADGTASDDEKQKLEFFTSLIKPKGRLNRDACEAIRQWRPVVSVEGVDCPWALLVPWYLDKVLAITSDDDGYSLTFAIENRQAYRRREGLNTLFDRRTFGMSDRWHPADDEDITEFVATTLKKMERSIRE